MSTSARPESEAGKRGVKVKRLTDSEEETRWMLGVGQIHSIPLLEARLGRGVRTRTHTH